jgi:transposase-like protein
VFIGLGETSKTRISYKRYRFPPAVIQYAVRLYFRLPLSLRDVEEMLAHRGVDVSYETIRARTVKFGPKSQPTFAVASNRPHRAGISMRWSRRS